MGTQAWVGMRSKFSIRRRDNHALGVTLGRYSIPRNNDAEAWHSTRVHVPSTVYRIRQTSHLIVTWHAWHDWRPWGWVWRQQWWIGRSEGADGNGSVLQGEIGSSATFLLGARSQFGKVRWLQQSIGYCTEATLSARSPLIRCFPFL